MKVAVLLHMSLREVVATLPNGMHRKYTMLRLRDEVQGPCVGVYGVAKRSRASSALELTCIAVVRCGDSSLARLYSEWSPVMQPCSYPHP